MTDDHGRKQLRADVRLHAQASAKAADIGKLLNDAQNAIASIGHQNPAAT